MDGNGKRLIQEDMLWGDTAVGQKKIDIDVAITKYLKRNYPNECRDDTIKGMVKGMWSVMRDVRKELKECSSAKMKMDFFPKAYSKYGITYIRNGIVLPATCMETIKKSWQQDWTDRNAKKLHSFWDHERQQQTLWAELFSQEAMESCNLTYDPKYNDFKQKNRLKKQGPKFKDGALLVCSFYIKMRRNNFRDGNKMNRDFKIRKRGKKGMVGDDLQEQLVSFCNVNKVITTSASEMESCRAIAKLKENSSHE